MIDRLITIADRLLADGYISTEERALLVTDAGEIVDDSRFPAEVCDNGDVYVHGGAYPLILKGYGTEQ